MTAHNSAGPHASLAPPRPVLLLRYPPGPPSPRLSGGPRHPPARRCKRRGMAAMLAECARRR